MDKKWHVILVDPSLPHVSFSGTFLPPAPRRSDVLFEWPLTRSIISDTSFLCRDSLSTLSFIFRVSNSTTRILRCSTSYVHVEEQVSYLLPLQSDHLHRHQTFPTLRIKIFANYVQVSIVYSIVLKTKVPVKTWCLLVVLVNCELFCENGPKWRNTNNKGNL
jgi:hypothetical protein